MANSYFEVETGLQVGAGNIVMDAVAGTISTAGNVTVSGNIIYNTTPLSYNANTITPKSYVDVIGVVFGM